MGVDLRPHPSLTVGATGFWNQIEDRVDFVFRGFEDGQGRLQRENIGKTRLRGLEAEVGWRPHHRLRLDASYTFIDSRVLGASDPDAVGNEVSEVPRDQVSLQASYDAPRVGRLGLVGRYVGEVFDETVIVGDRNEITRIGLPRTVRAGFSYRLSDR